jgi:hypothetical protein
MNLTRLLATATTAAVLGTTGVSIAGAAGTGTGTDPAASAESQPGGHHRAHRGLRRALARHAVRLAAETIGIPPGDLVAELRAGKTIAQVASDHGVDAQTVIDAIVDAATERIERARDAGKISEERAAELLDRLPEIVSRFVNEWQPKRG